jgi:hypothetical protein
MSRANPVPTTLLLWICAADPVGIHHEFIRNSSPSTRMPQRTDEGVERQEQKDNEAAGITHTRSGG